GHGSFEDHPRDLLHGLGTRVAMEDVVRQVQGECDGQQARDGDHPGDRLEFHESSEWPPHSAVAWGTIARSRSTGDWVLTHGNAGGRTIQYPASELGDSRMGPSCGSTCMVRATRAHGSQVGIQPSSVSWVFVSFTRFRSQMPPGPEMGTGGEGIGPGVGLGVGEGMEDGSGDGEADALGRGSRATSSACGAGAKCTLDSRAFASGTTGVDWDEVPLRIQTRPALGRRGSRTRYAMCPSASTSGSVPPGRRGVTRTDAPPTSSAPISSDARWATVRYSPVGVSGVTGIPGEGRPPGRLAPPFPALDPSDPSVTGSPLTSTVASSGSQAGGATTRNGARVTAPVRRSTMPAKPDMSTNAMRRPSGETRGERRTGASCGLPPAPADGAMVGTVDAVGVVV